MATSMAKKLVADTLRREVPVIEVNLEPCVNVGHCFVVKEKAEIALPNIFGAM